MAEVKRGDLINDIGKIGQSSAQMTGEILNILELGRAREQAKKIASINRSEYIQGQNWLEKYAKQKDAIEEQQAAAELRAREAEYKYNVFMQNVRAQIRLRESINNIFKDIQEKTLTDRMLRKKMVDALSGKGGE